MSDGGYTGWAIGSGFIAVGPHSEVHGPEPRPRVVSSGTSRRPTSRTSSIGLKAAGAIVVAEPY